MTHPDLLTQASELRERARFLRDLPGSGAVAPPGQRAAWTERAERIAADMDAAADEIERRARGEPLRVVEDDGRAGG